VLLGLQQHPGQLNLSPLSQGLHRQTFCAFYDFPLTDWAHLIYLNKAVGDGSVITPDGEHVVGAFRLVHRYLFIFQPRVFH
jgi:hypothetical protein